MSRIRPAKFVHVVYRTRRFEAMLQWYQTVFDAHVQHRNPMLAFLSYDDEHHRFAFVNMAIAAPGSQEIDRSGTIGVDHVAYTYTSLGELLENWEFLKAKNIEPYWCVHHGVTVSLYYADPDGNQMEFQVDACATAQAANDFMSSPAFGENPIGVEFVPGEWLAQLRAGTPQEQFLVRQTHLPVSPLRGALG